MKDDRDERWLEKFSSRKKEKVKFLEQYMFTSLVNDKVSIKIEENADGFKSMPILSSKSTKQKTNLREYYSFPGKRIIQAMVVKSVPVGYTIDTGIDGKFHRGVLFSNKSSSNGIDYNSRRKRGAVNIGGQQLYGIKKSNSGLPRPISQNQMDDGNKLIMKRIWIVMLLFLWQVQHQMTPLRAWIKYQNR